MSRTLGLLSVLPVLLVAVRHRPRRAASRAPAAPGPLLRIVELLRARRRGRRVERALPDVIDLLVLGVRAGLLPLAAFRVLHHHFHPEVREAVREVIDDVDRGARFADALPRLVHRLGPALHPLVDGFVAADRDGLPLAPLLERLSADARAQRRRRVDALARQLPVRLAAPLVVCALPAFVLLAVVPLLLAALASLHR